MDKDKCTNQGISVSGRELNKIAASILLAGLIGMIVGKVTDIVYKPTLLTATRGFSVEIEATPDATLAAGGVPDVVDINALLASAVVENGRAVFKRCAVCHTVEANGAHRVGPNLWNVVGASKASKPGFTYSEAMISKGGTWDNDALYHYLQSPKAYIPGNKMAFAGIKKPQDIADIIAYLKSLR